MIKKIALPALTVLLALGAIACREMVPAEGTMATPGEETFYAIIEAGEESIGRTYADEKLHVLWDEDDRISLFARSTFNRQYRYMGKTGESDGSFEPVPFSGFYVETVVSDVYAVYPYRENTSLSGDIGKDCTLTVELPSKQDYRKNTFGPGSNLMVAVTRDTDLFFRNAMSYLVLQLYGSDIEVETITLKGNEREPLAGKAEVTMKRGGKPVVSMMPGGDDEIVLVCKQPVALGATPDKATEFWFAVPPMTFKQGFIVEVLGKDGRTFKHYTYRPVTLDRNQKVTMAPLGLGSSFIYIDKEPMYKLTSVSGGENDLGEIKWDFSDGENVHVVVSGYRCRCQTLDHIGFHLTQVDLKMPRFLMMEIPLERKDGDYYISKNEEVASVHLNRYGISENDTHLEFDLSITLSREREGDIRIVYSGPVK